ncbi:Zinc finger CCHC-type superfamily [Arabidopsis suecica]|uniref:Zinc finger CCHC-type superfamily n=1 Tax=Arabidopsis suecica TaxID=45249 RepID=A0A8T2BC78_ARASU|nr:Zinc finger CCHC-type superfamily [Arabidopsis suecica]
MSTSSEKFVQPAIPKFDGYYDFWSMAMENFLRSREMWSLVEEGIPTMAIGSSPANEAQRKAVEEAKLKDLKVKNFLFQAIDREILETILDKGTSKAIWESMKRKYQGSTKVRRAQLQALKREFELLAMKEGEKIDTFLGRTLSVVNKMKINGENVEQSTIVSKILRSLTRKFNYVVCSIEESNDLSTLTIDELHGSLLVHEGRMQEPLEEEHVLNVSQDERSSYGRGRGSLRGGRGRGRGRATPEKASIECFKCHKLGHFQYECPDWEKGAYYAELEEDVLLMAQVSFEEEECRDKKIKLDAFVSISSLREGMLEY